jgi:hypothetical protein
MHHLITYDSISLIKSHQADQPSLFFLLIKFRNNFLSFVTILCMANRNGKILFNN